MTYTRRDFGTDLKTQMQQGFDIDRLAKWAFRIYLDHGNELEDGLLDKIMDVVVMEEGEQFELTEEQLRALADSLLNEAVEKRC